MWKNFRTVCNHTKIKRTKYFLARRIGEMEEYRRTCCIRGYHVYKGKSVGEVLMCVRETHNTQGRYAVAVRVQNRAFIRVILSTVCSAVYLLHRWSLSLPLCSPMLLLKMELQRIVVPWDLEVRSFSLDKTKNRSWPHVHKYSSLFIFSCVKISCV